MSASESEQGATDTPASRLDAGVFEALLEYLKVSRGFDFTAYKRSTLMRRVRKRMQTVGVTDFGGYMDYLEVHPDEFTQLFNTILINVTDFFRDTPTWELIQTDLIPSILERKSEDDPVRVWSAGCASGEEAYSVAMLLAEALGFEQFHDRVKIYATDVDEEALEEARRATYKPSDVQAVPPELLGIYFERNGGNYTFDRELRRSVIFGRHDLIQDAPISRVDLLLCRNALMYFNSEAQERILGKFDFALADSGYLVLGKAETMLAYGNTLQVVDLKRRVFMRSDRPGGRNRIQGLRAGSEDPGDRSDILPRLREGAFQTSPAAQIIIDADGILRLANERARSLFRLASTEMGTPVRDLELSYRPVEIRSVIEAAYTQERVTRLKDVEWRAPDRTPVFLDVEVAPILDGQRLGVCITYLDVTQSRGLQESLQQFNQELETANEELQSTNEELQTTNEELQSTIEELETTNEELQSTNEELETMNEELQSTNEEMEALNKELVDCAEASLRATSFTRSILAGLRDGVVVVDRDLKVLAWNHRAEDLWGLRADEVINQHLLNIDIGLPVDNLRQPIRSCLQGERARSEVTVKAINRRGRSILCRLALTPLIEPDAQIDGVIITMEEQPDSTLPLSPEVSAADIKPGGDGQ